MKFRTVPPPFTTDFRIALDPLEDAGGIMLLRSAQLEVFRLEFIFPFGLLQAPDIQTGQFLPRLLTLGTVERTAYDISEGFEKLGGFLDISMGLHRTTVTLHGLSRYFSEYLPLLTDVLFHPTFPENEIEIQRAQAYQNYQVDQKKASFQANKAFKEAMYGANNLAGQTPTPENIRQLDSQTLQQFHARTFLASPCDLYLCGYFSETDLSALMQLSAQFSKKNLLPTGEFPPVSGPLDLRVEMEDSIQCSLIIGKRLFNRAHPDFLPFLVMNTLFGGYFGSRLMKNIREEKGLTYGISSSLASNGPDGVFSIRAEVNKEKLEQALEAISAEKEVLFNAPVGTAELTTVKNYIKGNILSGTNTIFDMMDKHKAIRYEALPPDFYESMSSLIDQVSPEEVTRMARTWLNNFSTVIAG